MPTLGTLANYAEQELRLTELMSMKTIVDDLYDATVRPSYEQVGSVIDSLKAINLGDNILFFLISNHGEEFGVHGGWQHDQSVYDELIRIPLIVHFPEGKYGGTRISTQGGLIDLMPTILDFVGENDTLADEERQGMISMIESGQKIENRKWRLHSMRVNVSKYLHPFKETRGDTNIVVRRGAWKVIYNLEYDDLKLYNVHLDPHEQRDRSQDFSAERRQAMAAAENFWRCA